ncbi:hypothetical protein CRG98_046455, partial [Punica granatum]
GADNPNQEVMARTKVPTPRNRENPQIGDSPDSGGCGYDPRHQTLIRVIGGLSLIGVVNAL